MKVSKYVIVAIVVSLILSNIFLSIRVYQLEVENMKLKEGIKEAINYIFDIINAIEKYVEDREFLDYVTESNIEFWNWYWNNQNILQ